MRSDVIAQTQRVLSLVAFGRRFPVCISGVVGSITSREFFDHQQSGLRRKFSTQNLQALLLSGPAA
jgi:hypothetical protein